MRPVKPESSFRHLPRLLPYLRPYRALLGLSVLLSVVSVGISLAEPWPLAFLIDSALGDQRAPGWVTALVGSGASRLILFSVVAALVITVANSGINIVNNYIQTRLEQRMILDFRSDLFAHVQRLSLAFHDDQRKGSLMFAINYQAAAVGELTVTILPLLQSVLTVLGMLYVAYRFHPVLALLSLVVVPFIYVSSGSYGRRIEPRLRRVRGLEGTSLSIVHEAMSMLRVILAFNRERYEHERFRSQGTEAVEARIDVTVRQTAFSLAVNFITAVGAAIVTGFGAHLVVRRQLTIGELVIVLSYIAAIYQPLEQISGTIARMREQLISLEAAVGLMDTEPDVTEAPDAVDPGRVQGHVTFDDVHFSYKNRVGTLKGLSFEVRAGELIGIVGPTGAGKSTTVALLPRFFDPSCGRITLDGTDIRQLTLEGLRRQVSIVLQEPLLFSGSIAENIRYGELGADRAAIVEAAKAANAHDFISRLPQQYETSLGEGGAKMSGGERQRIAIARAFLKDAPILILDEPTSSVDSRTEAVILDALSRLAEGRTTFMIAHRLSTIRNASRIIVIDDGEVVEQGTHQELLDAHGLYAEMHHAQVGLPTPAPAGLVSPVPPVALPVPAPVPVEGNGTGNLQVARDGDRRAQARGHRAAHGRREEIVVLGMMTKMPVAGVVYQTVHYLLGLERLGYAAHYVEAHGRTPSMLMAAEHDDGPNLAAAFIDRVLRRFGVGGSWAYQSFEGDGALYGMSEGELARLYRDAALLVNLHGGTEPRPEHYATGRLAYLETDPVQLQVELHDDVAATLDFLEPHCAFFTFAENYGTPGCGLPVDARFEFHPTRQPVVLDLWAGHGLAASGAFTTVGNWHQAWRPVSLGGRTYSWSKDRQWQVVLDLPRLTGRTFELALSSYEDGDRAVLESHGWRVRPALPMSADVNAYRAYVCSSLAEFTVAKEQNVGLRSGWFSDRSATYLAAGRPVVTEDTGFGTALPTGAGLLAFSTLDEAAVAVEAVATDYDRHRRAAAEVARECFAAETVLGDLLGHVGLGPRASRSRHPFPLTLDLQPVSKRPLRLADATVSTVMGRLAATRTARVEQPRASVVVVTFDNELCTRLCLESLAACTGGSCELIVVDNASTDGTLGYLDRFAAGRPGTTVVRNTTNEGFARAANRGLAMARGDVLVLMNNDVVVTPGWLDGLAAHTCDPGVGLVGPVTNQAPNEAAIPARYRTFGQLLHHAARQRAAHRGEAFDISVATMFCVALRREVFARIGALDEQFGTGLFEDDDYSLRVRAAGLDVRCARDVFVHHFGEASFGDLVPTGEYGRLFERNRARFEAKWQRPWQPHRRPADASYAELVGEVGATVRSVVPRQATVAVVSKGDPALVDFDDRVGWHFPQGPGGQYAGHHPADSADAVAQLEALVDRGAGYLVIPATASWWLDHYGELARYLEERGREVGAPGGSCRVFSLANVKGGPARGGA